MSEWTIEGDETMRWDVVYGAPRRYATVTGARSEREVAAYLPDNYTVAGSTTDPGGRLQVHIVGTDSAGWTLDDYVIPRLASGCLWAHEDMPQVTS